MAKLRDRQNRHVSHETHDAHIVCDCGEVTTTEREPEYKVIDCDACGRELFVLPAPPQRSGKRKKKAKVKARAMPRPTPEADASSADKLTLESRSRLITPLRITIVLCVTVVAATGFWLHRRSVRTQAERNWVTHSEAGRDAMRVGDFDKARREFDQAVAAAEVLQRDDVDTRRARQMSRECSALADQSSEGLYDILNEAAAHAGNDWATQFKRDYAGKWLVLETKAFKQTDGSVTLQYPLDTNGRPVQLESRFAIWKSVQVNDKPKRVIVAVQLASCKRAADGHWVVGFNPDSAFLWTNYDNLLAAGFTVAPESRAKVPGEIDTESELRAFLKSQAIIMGVTE